MRLLRFALCASVAAALYAAVMAGLYLTPLFVPAGLLLAGLLLKEGRQLTAYGRARFATVRDVEHAVAEKNGIVLGWMDGKIGLWDATKGLFSRSLPSNRAVRRFLTACYRRKQRRTLVRLHGVHWAVFAPSGAGKTVSLVLPLLLTDDTPTVVTDPKGEIYRLVAAARRRMGHRVVCIDPFDIVKGGDGYNPLAHIDPDSDKAPDECRAIANALCVRKGTEQEPFWNNAAESEIALAIGFVVCFADPEDRNLQTVSRILACQQRRLDMIDICRQNPGVWHGLLARWAEQSAQLKDKTLASVAGHVHTHLRFLDTPAVMRNTVDGFNPGELLTGKTTVFLVLPPEYLRSGSGLLRLWIGSLLRTCVKGGQQEKRLVRFVLDEAASLGQMDALQDAVDQYRGYGVRLMFIYQSLGQLRRCWPDDEGRTLLGNCSTVFFGVNDPQTATFVSDRLGDWTQVVQDWGDNDGGSASRGHNCQQNETRSWGTNRSFKQAGRKLLKPEEVMGLDQRVAITFTQNLPPIATYLCRSYERDYLPPRPMGAFRMVLDTFCLFVATALLAVGFTAAHVR